MKKLSVIFILISLSLLSCKAKDKTNNAGLQAASAAKNTTTETTVSAANTTVETSKNTVVESVENISNPDKVDLDLTKMSATMIYSTIFDMLVMPEDYIEKNIKLKGWFETYKDPYTNELYYAVVVPDATACCQQGIEFVWPGSHTYPDDFPEPGEDITIVGLYKITETDGVSYNYIEANSVEF